MMKMRSSNDETLNLGIRTEFNASQVLLAENGKGWNEIAA